LAPKTKFGLPAACRKSTNVVLPPNVIPTNGLICHSARASDGASGRSASARTTATLTTRHPSPAAPAPPRALSDDHAEKDPRERRHGHIARRERKRPHQAAAVRHHYKGHIPRGQRDDERRRSAVADPELPDDGLALVRLHEPAQAVRQRLAVASGWCAP